MSTTIEQIDVRAMLNGWLKGLNHMFKTDVNAIPDEKWTATFGGCTRPCSDIAADTIGFLFWTAKAFEVGGTPTPDKEAQDKMTAACGTKAGALDMFDKATAAIGSALVNATDETLHKTANAPWGMEAPLYEFAQIAISHIWYHDGQLNYVQCLLGDDKFHWSH